MMGGRSVLLDGVDDVRSHTFDRAHALTLTKWRIVVAVHCFCSIVQS